MKRRILITGSSGMLGTDLCHNCLEKFEVYGTDIIRPKGANAPSSLANFLELNITDRLQTINLIRRIKPNLVIHAAAYTDVDGCEENKTKAFNINADGTQNVALGCKEANALLFYISTDFVFDGEKSTPYTEDDLPNPINIYGKSKLEGERLVKELLKEFVIIRTSWLFGEYGENFVNTILDKAEKKEELKVVEDQIGSPTYTKDLAIAIIKLAEYIMSKPASSVCHIANSGSVSWCKYAEQILSFANITDVSVTPITSNELNLPARRPKVSALNTGLYQKITGERIRNYKQALKEYIKTEVFHKEI